MLNSVHKQNITEILKQHRRNDIRLRNDLTNPTKHAQFMKCRHPTLHISWEDGMVIHTDKDVLK